MSVAQRDGTQSDYGKGPWQQEINQRQTEAGRGQGKTGQTSKQAKVQAGTVNKPGEVQGGQKEWDMIGAPAFTVKTPC